MVHVIARCRCWCGRREQCTELNCKGKGNAMLGATGNNPRAIFLQTNRITQSASNCAAVCMKGIVLGDLCSDA